MTRHRGHGEGSIVKRPDGTWQASVSLGVDPKTGKRKRPTVYGRTRKEVQEKLTKLLAAHQSGINIAPEKMLFSTWIDRWIEDYAKPNVGIGTWEGYEINARNHIKPGLGDILLTKLTTNDLQKFYNSKLLNGRINGKGGLSARTVRLIHVVIHSALEQAKAEGNVRTNVAVGVKLPAKKKSNIQSLKPEQLTEYLGSIKNDRLYAAFVLEAVTGMRKSELLGLEWADVNLETGECAIVRGWVRGPKGTLYMSDLKNESSRRVIHIAPEAVQELTKHKERQEREQEQLGANYQNNNYIFCREDGQPINPSTFTSHHYELLDNAKLPKVSFHAMRHSVASTLLNNDVDLKTVADLLGHSSIVTTGDIYAEVLEQRKRKTGEMLTVLLPKTEKETNH